MRTITAVCDSSQFHCSVGNLFLKPYKRITFSMSGVSPAHSNGYTTKNQVRLVYGGMGYFTLLEDLIDKAQHSVQLQTYIFESDATGTMIGEALMRAAKRNLAVYLLADGYASQGMSRMFIRKLEAAGVHFRFFEPFLRSR